MAMIAVVAVAVITYGQFFQVVQAADIEFAVGDFLVNDDETGGCTQVDPRIAMNSSGDAVIAWTDFRYTLGLIHARRFDADLNPRGPSFRVCNDLSSTTYHPSVSMNSMGSFAAVWLSEQSDSRKILAQLYDSHGRSIGANVEVSDPLYDFYRIYPSVALNDDGSFVVCWVEEVKDHTQETVARLMDAAGQPVGPVFQVSEPTGHDARYPRVASDEYGGFIITWTALTMGEVYVRSYDSDGNATSGPTVINRVDPDVFARNSSIAIASSGRYLITWIAKESSETDCFGFAKLFDASGTPLTEEIAVSRYPLRSTLYPIGVAMEESGNFTLVWTDSRNSSDDIYMREFDADGHPIGPDLPVSGADGSDYQRDGAIGSDGAGRRLIVWEDSRNSDRDIYGQAYSGLIAETGVGMRINDDIATSSQYHPDIACNSGGQFSITWVDRRDFGYACYLQVFDAAGNPVSDNVEVVDTSLWSADYPVIGMDAAGRSMMVWNSYSDGDIRAQYFDNMGAPIGADFSVNDTAAAGLSYAMAMNDSGKSVIAWWTGDDQNQPEEGLFLRRYDTAGNPAGSSQMVNDYLGGWEGTPAVAINADGKFVAVWYCYRSDDSTGVYAQLFDSAGVPVGPNIFVETEPTVRTGTEPSVCMNMTGAFVVTWRARDADGIYSLRARRFDPSGSPVGSEIVINDGPEVSNYAMPDIACNDDGDFVIAWHDRPGDNRNVYAQIFDSDGNPQGNNFIITSPAGVPFRQEHPVVAANNSSIFFAWDDTRRARGYDVYAKVSGWTADPVICGDADGTGVVDIEDVACLIEFIFSDSDRLDSQRAGDVDRSGGVDIDDVVYLIMYMFMDGNPPCDIDGD